MAEEKKKTGLPSIDMHWVIYYSAGTISSSLPDFTLYEYCLQNNRAFPNDIAILDLDRRISSGELFNKIHETTAAYTALGVKPQEIVNVALPSISETLYSLHHSTDNNPAERRNELC